VGDDGGVVAGVVVGDPPLPLSIALTLLRTNVSAAEP
jgi:hypothetical protein